MTKNNQSNIKDFIAKRKPTLVRKSEQKEIVKIPWFKKYATKDSFTTKTSKEGKLYVHHKEWSNKIWIGPYKDIEEANDIIDFYVRELNKENGIMPSNEKIHSVYIENEDKFFLNG